VETQCSVFIATSLDGYIARKDGSIDWLTGHSATSDSASVGEDFGYADFMATVDSIVMGRITYETVRSFPRWPYGTRSVFVLSKEYPVGGEALSGSVCGTSSSPEGLIRTFAAKAFRRVYVDGGKTIQSFLRAGLINDITITRIPILLGEGIPLFGSTGRDIDLQHLETKSYANGFVQSRYEVLQLDNPRDSQRE